MSLHPFFFFFSLWFCSKLKGQYTGTALTSITGSGGAGFCVIWSSIFQLLWTDLPCIFFFPHMEMLQWLSFLLEFQAAIHTRHIFLYSFNIYCLLHSTNSKELHKLSMVFESFSFLCSVPQRTIKNIGGVFLLFCETKDVY